jgi:hypothetical protein
MGTFGPELFLKSLNLSHIFAIRGLNCISHMKICFSYFLVKIFAHVLSKLKPIKSKIIERRIAMSRSKACALALSILMVLSLCAAIDVVTGENAITDQWDYDRLKTSEPYRVIKVNNKYEIPYFIIPFDKRGICAAPETRSTVINLAKEGKYTDIYIFAHGWNNDWTKATERYDEFLKGYIKMRQKHNLPMHESYQPLLIGLFWPSTALVFGEGEKGPLKTAVDPTSVDEMVREERLEISELANELETDQVKRFYELTQKKSLSEYEANELAAISKIFYDKSNDELLIEESFSQTEIIEQWRNVSVYFKRNFVNGNGPGSKPSDKDKLIGYLDPRWIVRILTFRQMKDRAGKVGTNGVGPLLRELLEAKKPRLHLIGHSFGGKVVLSGLCADDSLPRKVESMLLLQPAVSHLCFAKAVPDSHKPGGYREALNRVNKPILATYSAKDFTLRIFYSFGFPFKKDVGDIGKKIDPNGPPNKYAALGGFGPHGVEEKTELINIKDVNQRYQLNQGSRVIGLCATRTITGHGEISNESTYWALYSLVSK